MLLNSIVPLLSPMRVQLPKEVNIYVSELPFPFSFTVAIVPATTSNAAKSAYIGTVVADFVASL